MRLWRDELKVQIFDRAGHFFSLDSRENRRTFFKSLTCPP